METGLAERVRGQHISNRPVSRGNCQTLACNSEKSLKVYSSYVGNLKKCIKFDSEGSMDESSWVADAGVVTCVDFEPLAA